MVIVLETLSHVTLPLYFITCENYFTSITLYFCALSIVSLVKAVPCFIVSEASAWTLGLLYSLHRIKLSFSLSFVLLGCLAKPWQVIITVLSHLFRIFLTVDFRWSALHTKQRAVIEACACIILDFLKAPQGIIVIS